jgi:hypothetical protein
MMFDLSQQRRAELDRWMRRLWLLVIVLLAYPLLIAPIMNVSLGIGHKDFDFQLYIVDEKTREPVENALVTAFPMDTPDGEALWKERTNAKGIVTVRHTCKFTDRSSVFGRTGTVVFPDWEIVVSAEGYATTPRRAMTDKIGRVMDLDRAQPPVVIFELGRVPTVER